MPQDNGAGPRRRVMVTGGAGFIGSNLVDRLLRDGHEVSVVDSFERGSRANLAQAAAARVHEIDVRDPALRAIVAEERPDVVMHLAAQIDVRHSLADPVHDATVNIVGTLNLLEACRAHGVRKVIVASSGGCVYGEPEPADLPLDETHPGTPISPYGVSKRVLHDYLPIYRANFGIDWTVLALANVYGPRQDPYGEAGVVAIFIGALLEGRQAVIFGDGSQTRDFVYVDDVVDAFVAAIDRASGRVLNIGTGVETGVSALFAACARAAGVDAQAQHAPARAGELHRIALDARRAREALGWEPRCSLEEGLRATAAWMRQATPARG